MATSQPRGVSREILNGNRLLALLAPEVQERIVPLVHVISPPIKVPIYPDDGPMTAVYFPLGAVYSLLSRMEDGGTVEIATVGKEGIVGLAVFLEGDAIPVTVIAQIPGEALCMQAQDFHAVVDDSASGFRRILLRYTQAFLNQVAQQSACNRLHSIEERCARWILMTHDRVHGDEFPLTQEFLSYMLGTRRASVTVAAGMLASAGLIRYTRGSICVLDRKRLEEATCECYLVIQREYRRLLGFIPHK